MTSEIEKLLAVLDMPEKEQINWLEKTGIRKTKYSGGLTLPSYPQESLADLAFGLRDETRNKDINKWNISITIIALHINESPQLKEMSVNETEWIWAQHIILNQTEYSIQIIWIIAASIAKILAKGK